jgi:hypothetical protein
MHMWLFNPPLQIDSVRTQRRTVKFGVEWAARFELKWNPFRVNASFKAPALDRLTHFGNRSKAGNWLLSSASALALAATLSPTAGVAETQVGSSSPNPMAEALACAERVQESKYRFIYIDDAEIDGVSEFMRFLLYANDFADSLQGIVYTSSEFHYRGDPNANPPIPPYRWSGSDLPVGVDRIQVYQNIISGEGYFGKFGGYARAFPNLRKHDPRYPTPEHLLSLIRVGNVDNVGEMTKVTPGSTLIKEALLDDNRRPLWLVTGGGTNTIAAALSQVAQQYENTPQWERIRKHIIATTHVYIILNQDNTLGDYIKVAWPDLDVVLNRAQFWCFAYPWSFLTTPDVGNYFMAPFEAQIAQGPMLATYPLASDGSFNSDGDAPMYFQLLPIGLRSEVNPTWGGWGGRFAMATKNGWSDIPADLINPNDGFDFPPAKTPYVADSGSGSTNPAIQEAYPFARWIPAIQNDMLSRSQWQTADYAHANHPPIVFVPIEEQNIHAAPGQMVFLHGFAADPGCRNLTTLWWQYLEAGTYPNAVNIPNSNSLRTFVVMPKDATRGQTIHLILQATNDGAPPLTRYQRVVITCGRADNDDQPDPAGDQ